MEHGRERRAQREAQGYHWRRLAAGAAAAVILAALLAPFPPASREIDALTDLTHVPLFAVAAGAAAWWLRRRGRAAVPSAIGGWIAAVAIGAAVEILQALVGREASLGDLWADAAGATAGVLIAAGRGHAPARGLRLALTALAAVAALAGAAWPALRLWDVARQRLNPARLATFEDALELDRWSFDGSLGERSRQHATEGRFALRVELQPGRYPGVGLISPPPDWSAYARLSGDLFVEGDAPLELRVKVEDERHTHQLSDRFQRVLTLPPGPTHIEILLAEVAAAPQGRRLDLSHVAQLRFFAVDLRAPRVFFLDNLALAAP